MRELTVDQKNAIGNILTEFKPLHPWQGTDEEKHEKWNTVTEKIGQVLGVTIHFKLVDDALKRTVLEALARGEEPPQPDPDTLYLIRFSVITLLTSIARKCLEATPAEAEFFAVEYFSAIWPKLFSKLVAIPLEDGRHMYLKAEDAEKYRQAMEEAGEDIDDKPDDGGDDGFGEPVGSA